jgi:hypothetical protein
MDERGIKAERQNASMKFRVLWDVLPCSQVDDQRFRGVYGPQQHCPDDGGSIPL